LLRRKDSDPPALAAPDRVIGGFAGLLLKQTGLLPLDNVFLESVNYHMIAIGFIALGLRIPRREKGQPKTAAVRDGTRNRSVHRVELP
jgi:hypothetical protein